MNVDEHRSEEDSGPGPRVPPHNLDAERALLGAALLSSDALEVVATRTTPADYYRPAHAVLARHLTECYAEDVPGDPLILAERIGDDGWPEGMGPAILVELMADAPGTANAAHYAQIVHDAATRRRLIAAANRTAARAYEDPDAHANVTAAHRALEDVASSNGARTYSAVEVADVDALLAGGLHPEEADFLTRTDGHRFLYAGKMHLIAGHPGTGKSWLAASASAEVLAFGGSVVYLDYEDAPKGILGRHLALGADVDDVRARFRYVQIVGGFGLAERAELHALLTRMNPDLVVIDGVAESLARDGYDENSAGDYVKWVEALPRPIARTGAAVLMIDHLKKDDEGGGKAHRGTGAKLGAIDGAAFLLKAVTGFSRKRAGASKITITKDRPGGVGAAMETVGVMKVEPHGDGARVIVTIEPDVGKLANEAPWKPTVIMRKVSEELARSGQPMMASTIRSIVHVEKPALLTEAIARLEQEGFIRRTKLGRSVAYSHHRPYPPKPGDGPTAPEEPGATVTALFPDQSRSTLEEEF